MLAIKYPKSKCSSLRIVPTGLDLLSVQGLSQNFEKRKRNWILVNWSLYYFIRGNDLNSWLSHTSSGKAHPQHMIFYHDKLSTLSASSSTMVSASGLARRTVSLRWVCTEYDHSGSFANTNCRIGNHDFWLFSRMTDITCTPELGFPAAVWGTKSDIVMHDIFQKRRDIKCNA
jgi:hypothetical protein